MMKGVVVALLLFFAAFQAHATGCFPADYSTVPAGTMIGNETVIANCAAPLAFASLQTTIANPVGTTSATAVMMGLAGAITPTASGKFRVTITGNIKNTTGVGDGATAQLSFGTGAAPANGAAVVGTQTGSVATYVASTTAAVVPFACEAVITGQTVGTALWLDLAVAATTAGTATVTSVTIAAEELP